MILVARDVTARYRPQQAAALQSVTCEVAGAELVAVVGPNGSGKTTLMRAMLGLVRLERGTVLIDGRPLREWSRRALARTVGVVGQQEQPVFPLSVAETVMLGRYAHLGPVDPPGARDRTAVAAALERCDIADLSRRSVDTLSGGEWQRVRIARALAQEPRALILDEPTASLDVRHEMELFELTRGLVSDGLASLVITHHLNLAARFADRIVLLNSGAVVAAGSPNEVLDQDMLSRIFQWPVAVTTWQDGSPQIVPLRTGERRP